MKLLEERLATLAAKHPGACCVCACACVRVRVVHPVC
jgi:streptolysin S family bacteriocin protoxin